MKRELNKDNSKFTWTLNKWYEKVVYVYGVICVVWFLIAFAAGFYAGLGY